MQSVKPRSERHDGTETAPKLSTEPHLHVTNERQAFLKGFERSHIVNRFYILRSVFPRLVLRVVICSCKPVSLRLTVLSQVIEKELDETTFGDVTERSIAEAFEPQVRRIQVVIRHRHRIS
jgi:hypothetical protein